MPSLSVLVKSSPQVYFGTSQILLQSRPDPSRFSGEAIIGISLRGHLRTDIGSAQQRRSSHEEARMADKVPAAVRSKMMAAVHSKDTGPERAVRAALFSA